MVMLAINLLPENKSAQQEGMLQQVLRAPILWIGVSLVVLGVSVMALGVHLRNLEIKHLKAKEEALEPQKVEVQKLQQVIEHMQQQHASFERIGEGHVPWSERLFLLAKAVPPSIWYNELIIDEREGMRLQGMAIEQDGSALSRIGDLVKALSITGSDASFGPLQIDAIQREKDGNIELVSFTLVAKHEVRSAEGL